MKVTGEYQQVWESFWQDMPDEVGGALWDVEPALASALHLPHFEGYFDPGLPLVDLGCGNGTQTRFLAERYHRVTGADLSKEAVARARRADPHGAAGYEVLDAVDRAAMRRLHAETGDANVYMRGVLHQCAPQDRAGLVAGIAELTGGRGRVFAVELAEAAKGVLGALAAAPAGPSPKLRAIFSHGIAPGEVADAAVPGFFAEAGLDVLAQGEQPLLTVEFDAAGERVAVPSKWLVAGRKA